MRRVGHALAVAFWFVLGVVMLAGCAGSIGPIPNPNPPAPGAATCSDVCGNGRRLRCAFAEPTPNGVPCERVCQNNQDVAIAAWDLDCRARAGSCSEIDGCR